MQINTPKTRKTVQVQRAVVVALWKDEKIFLVQRSKSQKSGGGLWQLPGGKLLPGENAKDGAVREIQEELGLKIDRDDLIEVTGQADQWAGGSSNTHIHMTIFSASTGFGKISLASEFADGQWVPLEKSLSSQLEYMGSNKNYIERVARYQILGTRLHSAAVAIDRKATLDELAKGKEVPMEIVFLLVSLGLAKFEDEGIAPTSRFSSSIVNHLAEWSKTNFGVFGFRTVDEWMHEARAVGNFEQLEELRTNALDDHEALLGTLSYRLAKSQSHRNIADLLLVGANEGLLAEHFLLLRWDFLARKFQIPARGLEEIGSSPNEKSSALFVAEKRFGIDASRELEIDFLGELETAHVGAGSLMDGPILRTYRVGVFQARPISSDELFLEQLRLTNQISKRRRQGGATGLHEERAMNFFVWVPVSQLIRYPRKLLGENIQGFEELMEHFLIDDIISTSSLFRVVDERIPVVSARMKSLSDIGLQIQ